MLKRGILFLLVFIIFLAMINLVNAQAVPDSCLVIPANQGFPQEQIDQLITEAAARIWNIYSQIPEYSGNNEKILQAALQGLEIWQPGPQYIILKNHKEEISSELRG